MNFAYKSEYYAVAGIRGYINEKGEEVIFPQYLYTNDFESDFAIVCKELVDAK